MGANVVEPSMKAAQEHHQAGRLPEAERICLSILQAAPDHPQALNLLGVIANQTGRSELSVSLLERAIRLQPASANFLSNLGVAYYSLGRHEESVATCERALALQADHVAALINRGNALQMLRRHEEAVASYRTVLALKPDHAGALNNVGNALRMQGKLEEAVGNYRRALALNPDLSEARLHLAATLNDLGAQLKDQHKLEAAIDCYRGALQIEPEFAEVHFNLGVALKALGRRDQALACYERALALKPDLVEARWAVAMSAIPVAAVSEEASTTWRGEFERALAGLDGWFQGERVRAGYRAVGMQQPFHLAYREENWRDLLARYGALCSRLMSDWLERQRLPAQRPAADAVIRLGIVSGHFYNHSIWHAILDGLTRHLDRARFELHLFYLGTVDDEQTGAARSRAHAFVHGQRGLREWVEEIANRRPHALLYPEIGLDPMTTRLASLRLAPVQLAMWGHPHTTGLPTMDHFVSAEDLEPEGAEAHYTERLVKLPHLGCSFPATGVRPLPIDLGALGIDGRRPILICAGAPFKYAPEHDRVLVEIARKLGRCQLVFFRSHLGEQSDLLRLRLRSAFSQAALDSDEFVVFVPWQIRGAFYGLMCRAQALLDTIGFSGFNTAMQAVECGLPIVTREGRFMRGRLASGILRRMGMQDLVAPDEDAYIELAGRLVRDPEFSRRTRMRMLQARGILFDDTMPVRALEDLVADGAGRS